MYVETSVSSRVLAKTVRQKNKIVYRAKRIPFVTNINYLKGIFAQISASVRARVIKFFLIGASEVQGSLPVQGGGHPLRQTEMQWGWTVGANLPTKKC